MEIKFKIQPKDFERLNVIIIQSLKTIEKQEHLQDYFSTTPKTIKKIRVALKGMQRSFFKNREVKK